MSEQAHAASPFRGAIRAEATYARGQLLQGFTAAFALLPIALTAAPGVFRAVGFAYLGLYAFVTLPAIWAAFWMLLDCTLILVGRQPIVLPAAIAAAGSPPPVRRRFWRWLMRLAVVAFYASPLTNIMEAVFRVTITHRGEVILKLALAVKAARAKGAAPTREPTAEVMRPVLVHAHRDGTWPAAPTESQRELALAYNC
jgi:hypothetical protein